MPSKLRLRVTGVGVAIALTAVIGSSAHGASLWWPYVGGGVGTASTSGTGVDPQAFGVGTPAWGVAANADHVYWTDSWNIWRAPRAGGSPAGSLLLTPGSSGPLDVAVNSTHLYWAGNGRVGRSDLDGQNANPSLVTIPALQGRGNDQFQIAVDDTHIYWADQQRNRIGRANLDGTSPDPEFVHPGTNDNADYLMSVAVDDQWIYWGNHVSATIGRVRKSNGQTDRNSAWITTGSGPAGWACCGLIGLAVDRDHIYWSHANQGLGDGQWIGRAGIDGTNPDKHWLSIDPGTPLNAPTNSQFGMLYSLDIDFTPSSGGGGSSPPPGGDGAPAGGDGGSTPTPQSPSPAGTGTSSACSPPAGPVGVSVADKAQYVNTPEVDVSVVWPACVGTVTLSNDGSFRDARTFAVSPTVRWRLDSSGPERLPKTVYVRFGQSDMTFSDDVILDQTAPRIARATARRVGTGTVLTVRARDTGSSVRSLEVRPVRRAKAARTMPYVTRVKMRGVRGAVRVRVRDAAGNWSRTVTAKPQGARSSR